MSGVGVLAALALLLVTSAAHAQETTQLRGAPCGGALAPTRPVLRVGHRIRAEPSDTVEGPIVRCSASLLVVAPTPDSLRTVDLSGPLWLEVQQGDGPRRLHRALLWGVVVGTVAGFFGYQATDYCAEDYACEFDGVGVVVAAPAFLVGALLGAVSGGDSSPEWIPVTIEGGR